MRQVIFSTTVLVFSLLLFTSCDLGQTAAAQQQANFYRPGDHFEFVRIVKNPDNTYPDRERAYQDSGDGWAKRKRLDKNPTRHEDFIKTHVIIAVNPMGIGVNGQKVSLADPLNPTQPAVTWIAVSTEDIYDLYAGQVIPVKRIQKGGWSNYIVQEFSDWRIDYNYIVQYFY